MGFRSRYVFSSLVIRTAYKTAQNHLPNRLSILKISTPVRIGISLAATLGVPQTTFSITGPTTREFKLITEPLKTVPAKRPQLSKNKKACTIAKIEFFHNTQARNRLATSVWSRLRLLDPTLLPWNLDETLATNNPQVMNKDQFMQNICFGAF